MIPIETERLIISHGTIEDNVKVHEYDFNYLQGIERNCEKIGFIPYEQIKVKNFLGNECIEYRNIMSKERFDELYKNEMSR